MRREQLFNQWEQPDHATTERQRAIEGSKTPLICSESTLLASLEAKQEVDNMSDHTPGTWKWWTSNSWRRLKAENGGDVKSVLEPLTSPADGHPDLVVSEADMALIASAPELLEALKELTVFAVGERNVCHACYSAPNGTIPNIADREEIEELDAMIARARAAIEKATGEKCNDA